MSLIQQNATYTRTFLMVLSSDHVSPATGVTVTVTLSKAGAAFGAAAGAVTEIANGWYKVALTTTDTNTLGDLSFHCTGATCDPTDFADQVVAFNPLNANLGLTNVTADLQTIKGQTVTCAGGVTIPAATLASTTNITAGTITTVSSNVTVGSYAAGQDPATLVLDVSAASHNTAGTIGSKINSAASAGDPWATALPGAYGAGTAGNIVGNNLNATVSSRLATVGYTAPDNTSITAIKTQTDKLLFDGSNFVKSNPQTAVTVSGNVTVGGYAAGEDPATLVLDVAAASHNTANTIGAKINSAASAGDPWATALPGSYAAGTAGNILGTNLDARVSTRSAPATAQTIDMTTVLPVSPTAGTVGEALKQADKLTFTSTNVNANVQVNSDKTGYSLTQTFPTNFASLSIDSSGRVALAPAGVDAIVVETGLNLRQSHSIIASAVAGVLSGASTNNITIDGAGVGTTRIQAVVDSNDNRTSVTLTPPA